MTPVSILIVTYNPDKTILSCLRAIQSEATHDSEVIVIDNASQDRTVERVQSIFPYVKILANSDNPGYGVANNRGFALSHGDVIVILNPDVVVAPGAVQALVDFVASNGDVGVVGPRTLSSDGRPVITARHDYTVFRLLVKHLGINRVIPSWVYGSLGPLSLETNDPLDVDWLHGSALALRRDIYAQLGGFDEEFFLFMEDVDLCARARDAGLRVVLLPSAQVEHVGSESVNRFPVARIRSYHISPLHYFRKRGRPWAVRILKIGFTLELVGKSIIRRLQNLVSPDEGRREKARIEWQVISDVWKY
ncbi:MAG: glycosyltransferase family 2 protein [Chloroflexi bacterium]|nr:glycosyltransferase family 2 protein [Chloroflexota bacterium]